MTCRQRFIFILVFGLATVFCGLRAAAAAEQAPVLEPDWAPYAPYPGLPLNARALAAWNRADHIEADAALYGLYTNNFALTPVHHREDTYTRLRGRLQLYTSPGETQLHLSMSAMASRVQFVRHDELSDNEFAGALSMRLQTSAVLLHGDYTAAMLVVPDEDHFSLQYRSFHESRTVHDFTGYLGIGNEAAGLAGESRVRAIQFPGLAAGRNNVIVTENALRLGINPLGYEGSVFAREVFPFDYRGARYKGRFDARPIERAYDFMFEPYVMAYLGTVHVLNPDNLNALVADPAFGLGAGFGVQMRVADFFGARLEAAPMRFEMLGDNSTDHPGWQALYLDGRAVLAPWDALELHFQGHSGISEVRDAAYGQAIDAGAGFTYFINRNFETGLDYQYHILLASRHKLSRHGDDLNFHIAWRAAEQWGLDFRVETRRRDGVPGMHQFTFTETRVLGGVVFKPFE